MEKALENLRKEKEKYPRSREFSKFLYWKEQDFKNFKAIVSDYSNDTFVPTLVTDLRERGVLAKYLGMTQRPESYFKVTKKLQKALEAGL